MHGDRCALYRVRWPPIEHENAGICSYCARIKEGPELKSRALDGNGIAPLLSFSRWENEMRAETKPYV